MNSDISTSLPTRRIRAIDNIRTSIASLQESLTTGREANIYTKSLKELKAGYDLRTEMDLFQSYRMISASAKVSLNSADNLLEQLNNIVGEVADLLIAARSGNIDRSVLQKQSEDALNRLFSLINEPGTSLNPLVGENTQSAPLVLYQQSPKSLSKQYFEDAFQLATGLPFIDANLPLLTAIDIEAIITSYVPNGLTQFDWNTNWTSGNPAPRSLIIGINQRIELPNVNSENAISKIAGTLVLLSEMNTNNLQSAAYQTLLDRSITMLSDGMNKVTKVRENIGSQQIRLDKHEAHLVKFIDSANQRIQDIEGIDPYKASIELSQLQVNLEMSFRLTARLQDLFLAKYL